MLSVRMTWNSLWSILKSPEIPTCTLLPNKKIHCVIWYEICIPSQMIFVNQHPLFTPRKWQKHTRAWRNWGHFLFVSLYLEINRLVVDYWCNTLRVRVGKLFHHWLAINSISFFQHTDLSQYLEKHPGGLNAFNIKVSLYT